MIQKVIPTYWHRSENFGDCIAPYLLEKITGSKPIYVSNEINIEHIALIGSLLDTGPLNNTHVWGCGFARKDSPVYPPNNIYAVRGLLTRDKYIEAGISCPDVFGDPALLLPRFYNPNIEKIYRIGIIPHIIDYIPVLQNYANKFEDCLIIDLRLPVEEVINQILSCEKTISSSLHGLIVSHAYEIPSLWVEFSDNVIGNGFKFLDYLSTIETDQVEAINLRNFPDISSLDIGSHKIKINLETLLNTIPI